MEKNMKILSSQKIYNRVKYAGVFKIKIKQSKTRKN